LEIKIQGITNIILYGGLGYEPACRQAGMSILVSLVCRRHEI